jgi:Ca-activated chloride channel family protein
MAQPKVEIRAHVHPVALPRADTEMVASVCLELVPPAVPPRPLDLALVIDRSGSMAGAKIATARQAAARVVERMSDDGWVTVVAFSDSAEVIVPGAAVREARPRAVAALTRLEGAGGTDLTQGLQAAMSQLAPRIRPEDAVAVFIVTDGQDGRPEQALAEGTAAARSVALYAAGVGENYDHNFLERLCTKNRVDHVQQPEEMLRLFEAFLERDGRRVSANGQLVVACAPGVKLHEVTSFEDRGQKMALDGVNAMPVRDLTPDRVQQVSFQFAVTPSALGLRPLATFRFRYDLPSAGILHAEGALEVGVEVTSDPGRANVPNPEVLRLVRKISTARLAEKAEKDLARSDVRGATEKLERVTRNLRDLGEQAAAKEFQERAEALRRSQGSGNLDAEIKRLRGTTKRLTQQ